MSPIYVPGKLTLRKEFVWNETVWNPSMITTALWLDAADASTITESGGAVSQWDDKSGNEKHAIQSSSALRPSYSSNKVIFDGTELMQLPSGLATLNSVSLFVVGRYVASVGVDNYLVFANGGGTDERFYNGRVDATLTEFIWSVENLIDIDTITFSTSTAILGLTHGSNIASPYYNGAALTTASRSKTTTLANWFLGGVNASTPRLDGELQEVILLNSVPPTVIRQKIEGYLAHKWGLTANLPAGHPYKLVGPTP